MLVSIPFTLILIGIPLPSGPAGMICLGAWIWAIVRSIVGVVRLAEGAPDRPALRLDDLNPAEAWGDASGRHQLAPDQLGVVVHQAERDVARPGNRCSPISATGVHLGGRCRSRSTPRSRTAPPAGCGAR